MSRKTFVNVETFQLSFRVFKCAFHPEISSFFRGKLPRSFPMFLCYPYFGTFLSTWYSTRGSVMLIKLFCRLAV